MMSLNPQMINEYRLDTFRLRSGARLKGLEDALDFVNQRGFVYFWPISGVTLPSLWTAVAGDRPVADAHDDPGHVTWGWKDSMLGKRRWYYAKILRKKATMISLDVAPYFYALSENYGSPEDDYLTLYEQGRLTQEAKLVYETLLNEGVMDSVALRRSTHMTSRQSDHRFNRALLDLQADFKILPVGVTQAGGWNYAFAYDLVARHFPELPDKARDIHENTARQKLVELYLRSVGAIQLAEIARLFGWRQASTERAVERLVQAGVLRRGLESEQAAGEWIALASLV